MRIHILGAVAMLAASFFSAAEAAPVTYTLSGTASGVVGAGAFTSSAFTWTLTGESTLIFPTSPGLVLPMVWGDSLTIAGIGTLTPSVPLLAFVDNLVPNGIGLVDSSLTGGIGFKAAALAGYNGISSIGPIPVTFLGSAPLPSNMGNFEIFPTSLTFQAVGVPEPLTLALFGAGLAGIGALRRKRKALV